LNFAEKRKAQMKISSIADLKRSGKISGKLNPALFVHGPEEFDCLVNKWSRQELLGLIGDSGVGKSEVVLQFFKHILQKNPDSSAVYVSLEMTDEKIGQRWFKITEDCPELAERLFILSRYDENGKSREVNVHWIKKELMRYKEVVGDIVTFAIDHVHCLGENDASTLNSLFITLKEMCVELNACGIAMAQVNKSSGQKGEVPLDADSVLGCSQMKYICSDIIQIHRPIFRLEEEAGMSVLSWGYVKTREAHKDDKVRKGQNKLLFYDNESRSFRKMNLEEMGRFKMFYNSLLEMKSAEEKQKAFTYDIQKEITTKDGRKILVTEKFSGDSGDDL
jgi:ABC-type dipeptide/oligopeptide/nickel transport system ATPase component